VFGISWLLAHVPQLLWGLRVGGAGYLTWLGYRMLATASAGAAVPGAAAGPARSAFLSGFLTNAANPKTTLFVISTLTQLGRPDSRLAAQLGSGAIMSLVHLLWFALVALLFSHARVRTRLAPQLPMVQRLIGAALLGLGLWLLLTNLI
jgi:threonine/homoserine/homoserine lactone efflux protein